MQTRIRPGISTPAPAAAVTAEAGKGRRLGASTFVELVATMLLLSLFALLGFSLYWGSAKAETANALANASIRSRLALASSLPRLASQVRPPYWEKPGTIFQSSGRSWTAHYFEGVKDEVLTLCVEGPSRLGIKTQDLNVSIDNLPDLSVDWWEKDGRIIGFVIAWSQDGAARDFHAAWGSFLL